jgi:hypothetical protein
LTSRWVEKKKKKTFLLFSFVDVLDVEPKPVISIINHDTGVKVYLSPEQYETFEKAVEDLTNGDSTTVATKTLALGENKFAYVARYDSPIAPMIVLYETELEPYTRNGIRLNWQQLSVLQTCDVSRAIDTLHGLAASKWQPSDEKMFQLSSDCRAYVVRWPNRLSFRISSVVSTGDDVLEVKPFVVCTMSALEELLRILEARVRLGFLQYTHVIGRGTHRIILRCMETICERSFAGVAIETLDGDRHPISFLTLKEGTARTLLDFAPEIRKLASTDSEAARRKPFKHTVVACSCVKKC